MIQDLEGAPDELYIQSVTLTPHKFANHATVSREILRDATFDVRKTVREDLEMSLQTTILGTSPEEIERRWPADWWEAFKARWLTSRVSRWLFGPVKCAGVRVTKFGMYPEIPYPERGRDYVCIPYMRAEDLPWTAY